MKKIKLILLIIIGVLFIASVGVVCYRNYIPNPKSNLEFWIAENVENVDFSNYQEKIRYDFMGSGRQYYGTGYTPTKDEEGKQVDPEYFVIYTVAPYPDYTSRKCHITGIYIKDPNISIYDLTINSSTEDIENTMTKKGFKSVAIGNVGYKEWVRGKYHISFSEGTIAIEVDVSNFWKIQF